MSTSPIRKNSRGSVIQSGERRIIYNVYKYFSQCHLNSTKDFLVQRTATACGVSERSVYKIIKEEKYSKTSETEKDRPRDAKTKTTIPGKERSTEVAETPEKERSRAKRAKKETQILELPEIKEETKIRITPVINQENEAPTETLTLPVKREEILPVKIEQDWQNE